MIRIRLPALLVLTERGLDNNGARAIAFVILVRRKFVERGDEGIIRHELEHVRQWWVLALILGTALFFVPSIEILGWMVAWWPLGAGAHHIAYWTCRRYRLWAEVRAHLEQVKYPDGRVVGSSLTLEAAAARIAQAYDLKVSKDEALRLLTQ